MRRVLTLLDDPRVRRVDWAWCAKTRAMTGTVTPWPSHGPEPPLLGQLLMSADSAAEPHSALAADLPLPARPSSPAVGAETQEASG
jgi:hypothetical protein